MAALRILHLIDSGGLYGAERVLLQLAMESTRRGHEVLIGTILEPNEQDNALVAAAARLGLDVIELRMRGGLNFKGVAAIRALITDRAINVVHSHGYKANIMASLLGTLPAGTVAVATLHGWTSTGFDKLGLYEWLERQLLSRLDRVVAVSPLITKRLRHLERRGRLQLIWNALPEPENATLDPSVIDFCRGGATVVAVGRLSAEKGFDVLLHAFHAAAAGDVALRLLILGDGPERDSLERLAARLGLGDRVRMPGYRAHAAGYFEYCQVFALSSWTEGLPLVLLEAMAGRLPVVATRVGAVGMLLRDGQCGRLVPAGDVASLSQALRAAMLDPDSHSRMLDAAQRVVTEHHSATGMTDAYESCYTAALAACVQARRIAPLGKLRSW